MQRFTSQPYVKAAAMPMTGGLQIGNRGVIAEATYLVRVDGV
jgi:hypothetical protein